MTTYHYEEKNGFHLWTAKKDGNEGFGLTRDEAEKSLARRIKPVNLEEQKTKIIAKLNDIFPARDFN